MRYVIIGAGVAGMAAVEAIRSIDKIGEIVMISDDPYGYYSRPGLAYYLTDEIGDRALYPRSQDDYKKLRFSFIKGRVTRILPKEHAIDIEGKPRMTYSKLLIAVGARATPLNTPGDKLGGVVKLDHLADARNIIKLARRGKHAVVVGGGITALELVEGLHARGMHVHYLLRGDRYWSNVLDPQESKMVEGRLQTEGVDLHFNSELAEIVGKRGHVTEVRLKDGKTIKCEIVAYAVGIRPCVELPRDAGLNVDRGILVDEHLQSSDPDIYAAGDIAQAYDPLSGRSVIDSLWNPARDQGFSAGLNMAGRKAAYLKSPPFNVTRLAGLTTTIIGAVGGGQDKKDKDIEGIARGDSETWRDLPDAMVAQSGFEINHLRLVIGKGRLLGALLMGDQMLSWPLQKIIANKADISSIQNDLLQPNARVADIIADFWTKWRKDQAL